MFDYATGVSGGAADECLSTVSVLLLNYAGNAEEIVDYKKKIWDRLETLEPKEESGDRGRIHFNAQISEFKINPRFIYEDVGGFCGSGKSRPLSAPRGRYGGNIRHQI